MLGVLVMKAAHSHGLIRPLVNPLSLSFASPSNTDGKLAKGVLGARRPCWEPMWTGTILGCNSI